MHEKIQLGGLEAVCICKVNNKNGDVGSYMCHVWDMMLLTDIRNQEPVL